jgi:hypothetical protein
MSDKRGQPPDDVSSAPESGTVRDETSGNAPSDRGYNPGQKHQPASEPRLEPDDPSVASEER